MPITKAEILLVCDRQAQAYARARGLSSNAYGIGTTGDTNRTYGAWADLVSSVDTISDLAVKGRLLTRAQSARDAITAERVSINTGFLSLIESEIKRLGETGVTSFLTYLVRHNGGAGAWNSALLPPEWLEIYQRWKSATLARNHLYFEVLEGGSWRGTTYTNALRKLVIGTGETAGATIGSSYAGGVPFIKASGTSGSGVVTVTGTEFNPANGTVTANKTWTATVNANGDFALASGGGSAASANALILACSGISAAGGLSAGTLLIEARKPTGRLVIP